MKNTLDELSLDLSFIGASLLPIGLLIGYICAIIL